MSMCKSSMTTGTPAMKVVDWMKVVDEELATDIDNTDSRYREQGRCDKRQRSKNGSARQKRQKNAGRRRSSDRRKQRRSGNEKLRRQTAAAEAKKWQQMHEAGIFMCHTDQGQEAFGMQVGREKRKQVKQTADNDDDNEIVILSGQKTRWQGSGETLEEITNQQWGELIQVVSTCMDVANGHLEKIVSVAQSNSCKMQWHYMLMEGLMGQQQLLLSRLVEIAGAMESGGAKGTTEGQEGPKELQGEELGGQEGETEGALGEGLGGALENAPGDELGNGTGVEDGVREEAQRMDKGKGKEKAL
ncbi:hypothetical protein ID866_9706 [Astraeus odoratus]|nr:hypothetical protein ID866_9706 [Astraeus odoratus]